MKSRILAMCFASLGAVLLPKTTLAQESSVAAPEANPAEAFVDQGILVVKTKDDSFKWWLDGRIQVDGAAYFGSKNALSNGTEIRRARLGINMVYWKDWAAQWDVEFADNELDVKDMWIGYAGLKDSLIKVGNFKEPFSLETLISSRYITFLERPMTDNFSPDRHVGASYSRWGTRWQASASVFGAAIGETDSTGEDQGYGAALRVTGTPLYADGGRRLIHVGLAGDYQTPVAGSGDTVRVRSRPETDISRTRFIDTGKISSVNHYTLEGAEFASVLGPWYTQAEYVRDRISRYAGNPSVRLSGWYAATGYFLTGESRPYATETGEFDRLVPRQGRGAWEVAVRYSTMNLNDFGAGITGGRERNITGGVNWYANANIRVMLDYGRVLTDKYAKGTYPSDAFHIVQARFQLAF